MNKRLIPILTLLILTPAALLSQVSELKIPTPIQAASGEAAIEFAATTNASKVGVPFVTGYRFTVKAPVTLNAIGAVLQGSSSKPIFGALPASSQVSLWDDRQKLLASATVTASDPLVGHFNYHAVHEIRLQPGMIYTIASFLPAGKSVLSDVPEIEPGSMIVYRGGLSVPSKVLDFPTGDTMERKNYFGASFTYLRSAPVVDSTRENLIGFNSSQESEN